MKKRNVVCLLAIGCAAVSAQAATVVYTDSQHPAFFRRLSRECRFVVSPHRFRHTVATNMMKSPDRNIQAVKRLLGHSSLRSTLEYIDEDVESLRDIMEQEFKR